MRACVLSFILFMAFFFRAEGDTIVPLRVDDPWLRLNAGAGAPLYTTYAAAMERSRLYGDKAYKMVYDEPGEPVHYTSDQAGRIYLLWLVNRVALDRIRRYASPPVVTFSFPDMNILEYELFPGLQVRQTFLVYSSTLAVLHLLVTNRSDRTHEVQLFPVLVPGRDSVTVVGYDPDHHAYIARHEETKERLISDLYANAPYPTHMRDLFVLDEKPWSYGAYRGDEKALVQAVKTDWYASHRRDSLNGVKEGPAERVVLETRFRLAPGESKTIMVFRGCQEVKESPQAIFDAVSTLKKEGLQRYLDDNVRLFSRIPRLPFRTEEEKLVYLGAFNLMRGSMLPPSGKARHNFYVFSRNPLWGWGHGHQVQHESLVMMAYAWLDPGSAEGSQRIFIDQQGENGVIPYRVGPRGPQTYPHKGEPTTSAPFFSWTNLEIFRISHDTLFLEDAYRAGVRYLQWLKEHRDKDHDGLYEWGPYGLIENVRDWYNVIFQVSEERHLDVDKEDISDELECLDLSLMVVREQRSLAAMARILDRETEAREWERKAGLLSRLINETMWDDSTGFYYHVDMRDHTFRFLDRDLRHREIIGFLPLWAGVADSLRAARLVATLTDTARFWRRYGIPTLSADDPFYDPYVDYCCKWNGPVWLLWNYMVYEGLRKYGYDRIARHVGEKMLLAVTTQLKINHNFWESYSPDLFPLDCPSNYIWDGIIARLLIRMYEE